MIYPPHNSDIEPGSYPNVLDRQSQTKNQFYRQRQQHTHRKKLECQVLQEARARQDSLFKIFLRKKSSVPRSETKKRPWETEFLKVDRHQPVEEESADQIETTDHDETKDPLPRLVRQKAEMQRFSDREIGRAHV